jgi:uncharacterized protein
MAKGAGGTPGGLGTFFGGAAMVVAGGYMLLTRVTVTSGFWSFGGYNAFGISMLPLLVGIGVLFFNGRSRLGWALAIAGAIIIVTGVVANMRIFFQSTSLFDTLMILGLIAGGVGLVARAVRSYETEPEPPRDTQRPA